MKNNLLNSNAIRFLTDERDDRSHYMRHMLRIRVMCISVGNDDISDIGMLSSVTIRSLKGFL